MPPGQPSIENNGTQMLKKLVYINLSASIHVLTPDYKEHTLRSSAVTTAPLPTGQFIPKAQGTDWNNLFLPSHAFWWLRAVR
jgi:hypothetical protein